jgi:hypothetical protein
MSVGSPEGPGGTKDPFLGECVYYRVSSVRDVGLDYLAQCVETDMGSHLDITVKVRARDRDREEFDKN